MRTLTHNPQGYSRIEPLLDAVAFLVKRFRRALRPAGRYVPRPDEIERLGRDLDLSPYNLSALTRKGASADELCGLLHSLGIDPKALYASAPKMMRDLQRVCAGCGVKAQCRRDIAVLAAADNYRDYCPNVFTLDTLFEGHPTRH